MPREKSGDPRRGVREVVRELGVRSGADHQKQSEAMADDGGPLVRLVADSGVVGYGNPASLADGAEPFLVRAVGPEVMTVPFDDEAGRDKDIREDVAKIAVGEKDEAQAARS